MNRKLKKAQDDLISDNQFLQRELELRTQLHQEKMSEHQLNQEAMKNTFESLSLQALERNASSFLTLAKGSFEQLQSVSQERLLQKEQAVSNLVAPINNALEQMGMKLGDLEKERHATFFNLKQQLDDMVRSQGDLKSETVKLSQALKAPHIRGKWGEIQLRRVIEMCGMANYCDYIEQESHAGDDGLLRPDVVIKLPGNKNLIIDSKVPLIHYLQATETTSEFERKQMMVNHAKSVRQHIQALSRKNYWQSFTGGHTPEFVILFIPGDVFFQAALEHDTSLLQTGIEHKVILASPATLIALLHAIAYGWRQENISQNAQAVIQLSRELYKRLCDASEHFEKVGSALNNAVTHYNRSVGSFERRVFPCARKLKELDGSTEVDLKDIKSVDQIAKAPLIEEFEPSQASVHLVK